MTDLTSRESLREAIETSRTEPIVLYKHSNRCGRSRSAQRRLQELSPPEDPEIFRVTVQEQRELSNYIAERFGIRHETPQLIVVDEQKPIFSASHQEVTAEAVREAIARQQSTHQP